MLSASGPELDAALAELGWADMLSDMPEVAIPLVFRLLGETGSHASVLNDVVLLASSRERGAHPAHCPTPAAAGWCGTTHAPTSSSALGGLPLRRVEEGGHAAAAPRPAGRWAGGWSVRRGRC